VALGNVIRGVPLQADGYFFLPLWTNWQPGDHPGILDWYTVICGGVAVISLVLHGAFYGVLKTSGDLNQRLKRAVAILWPVLVLFTLISLAATLYIRPTLLDNYRNAPLLFAIPLLVAASLAVMRAGNERAAFLGSCSYLIFMLLGAAAAVYPNLLTSNTDPSRNITVYNAHSGDYALGAGLVWWTLGMAIALGYFTFLYRTFRGKISTATSEHGY
jgi:cytochrome d ubiquinol oxidase subunit II